MPRILQNKLKKSRTCQLIPRLEPAAFKRGTKWYFDVNAGRQELLYRRIGSNELDAIQICHGYVEAQYEYAMQPHDEYEVNQFAQLIIATPGTQDGLAWQNADGT